MKKFVVMLLAIVMLLGLCACGTKEEPVEPVKIEVQPKVEATTAVEPTTPVVVKETMMPTEDPAVLAQQRIQEQKALAESCIDKDVRDLYELIGAPESCEYAPSCLVDGEDGVLYYEGFVVYTTREGDVENVYYVE
ncbi:MAG: hypothetical protein IKT52_04590 [Oscillospiraceae bacterium]|nr:hypothetical protein [Oscillospiraceae bacterium]